MRLGFYTDYTPEIAQFAEATGFKSMELSAWPQSSLNADEITDERIKEIRADLEARDVEISALGYYPNFLAADQQEADEYKRYFRKVLHLADRMDVSTVCTFAGQTPGWTVEDCMEPFADVHRVLRRGRRSRHPHRYRELPDAQSQAPHWREHRVQPRDMEGHVRGRPLSALGLEIDPSHLVFLGIDYIQAIQDFGDRIVHVHAKDIDIDERKRGTMGFYGQAFGELQGFGNGWWRFRAPGWGVIDWSSHYRPHRCRLRGQPRHRARRRGIRRGRHVEDRGRSRHRRDARKGAERTGFGVSLSGADDAVGRNPVASALIRIRCPMSAVRTNRRRRGLRCRGDHGLCRLWQQH